MMQYINKSALVAEIERELKNINLNYVSVGSHPSDSDTNKKLQDGISKNLQILLSFINTLEVKEVDLEKEINKYISDNFFGFETIGFFANRTKEEPNDQDIALCAKHFYELGLKTQKGE